MIFLLESESSGSRGEQKSDFGKMFNFCVWKIYVIQPACLLDNDVRNQPVWCNFYSNLVLATR